MVNLMWWNTQIVATPVTSMIKSQLPDITFFLKEELLPGIVNDSVQF